MKDKVASITLLGRAGRCVVFQSYVEFNNSDCTHTTLHVTMQIYLYLSTPIYIDATKQCLLKHVPMAKIIYSILISKNTSQLPFTQMKTRSEAV